MIKKAFLCIVVLLNLSCNSKKKYEGKWADIYYKSYNWDDNYEKPQNLIIENDSIKFNYLYFDHWHKYPLSINANQLTFDSFKVSASFKKDTLILNNRNYFISEKDTLYNWFLNNHLLSIDLPEIKSAKTYNNEYDPLTQVFIGKRFDNNAFALQLNDKLSTDFSDLREFLSIEYSSLREELIPFRTLRVYIDKNSPMQLLERIYYHSSVMNQLKIEFINSIELNVDSEFGIYYKESSIKKHLPPGGNLNDSYFSNLFGYLVPPPTPPYFSDFKNESASIIFLIDNSLYYNQEKISFSKLKSVVEETIKNNEVLISLYDLDSNYGEFLKVLVEIDLVYHEKRNEIALNEFGKTYDSLEYEEKSLIKEKVPQKHIWSYSIPHYQSFVDEQKDLMGLNVKPIDSLLPLIYIDSETMLRQAQHDNKE